MHIMVGDLVEVVDNTLSDLTVGSQHYVVDADSAKLKLEGQDVWYFNWRFTKVTT